jgi:hypothetical protein
VDIYNPKEIIEYGSYGDEVAGKPPVYRKEWNYPFGKNERLIIPSVMPWEEWQRILRYVYAQIS